MSAEIVGKVSGPLGTFRARLILDDDPLNPREQWDHYAHAVVVSRFTSHYVSPDRDGGPFEKQWERFRHGRDQVRAMELFVALAGGRTHVTSGQDQATTLWYVLPRDLRPLFTRDGTPQEMAELLVAEAAEYRAWCDGDVWGIVIEEESYIPRTDEVEWIERDPPVYGHYGYGYAVSAARDLLADLR